MAQPVATSKQATSGKDQDGDKRPLPLTFVSNERIMAEMAKVTGLKEEDLKYFRKPLTLQTRLANAMARYVQAILADGDLSKTLSGQPPTLKLLLAPGKAIGFLTMMWVKGEYVEKPVFGSEYLPRLMRDVYLDLVSTVPDKKVERHVFLSLVNPNPKTNPAVTTAAEVVKNLHLGFSPPKDAIVVVPHFIGEDSDKLLLKLAKAQ